MESGSDQFLTAPLNPVPSIPPPIAESSTLQDRFRKSTRAIHASLNRQILSHFPACLPSHTHSPLLYLLGLAHLSSIYSTIEQTLAHQTIYDSSNPYHRSCLSPLSPISTRLKRISRLNHDLTRLRNGLCRRYPDHESRIRKIVRAAEKNAKQLVGEVAGRLANEPVLVLAWAWCMYLALFNGGRHIYKALKLAGGGFWLENPRFNTSTAGEQTKEDQMSALSFWRFPTSHAAPNEGNENGGEEQEEDKKGAEDEDEVGKEVETEFKTLFDQAAQQLTDQQRDDVVAESTQVFQFMSRLVQGIDEFVKTEDVQLLIEALDTAVEDETEIKKETKTKTKVEYTELKSPDNLRTGEQDGRSGERSQSSSSSSLSLYWRWQRYVPTWLVSTKT